MSNNYNDQLEEQNVFMTDEQKDSSKEKTKEKEKPDTVPNTEGEIIRPGGEEEC